MRRPDQFVRDEVADMRDCFIDWCDSEYGGVAAWFFAALLLLSIPVALYLAISVIQ